MSNDRPANGTPAPLLEIAGFTVPADCRRIFITAELEPSTGDPRIQPTGFPDVGPVLYPDPNPDTEANQGLICLIESEPSMANRLEEVCFSNKYEGTLKENFQGLPYLRVESGGGTNRVFRTSSTLDGHRFASDFLAKARANFGNGAETTLAGHIKTTLGMADNGKTMPVARIPEVFQLVMELDTMSLIHGFQISNERISFVGLRLARALTGSIVGLHCERVAVPGVKFNIGQVESESGQAIFQKQRITSTKIQARFSIDVALLASLRLDSPNDGQPGYQASRLQLLVAIALWKVAAFLELLRVELSLRTECKLRLKAGIGPHSRIEGGSDARDCDFPYREIAMESFNGAEGMIASAHLPPNRSPLVMTFSS